MKPAGVILTFMGREDWIGKTWWVKLRTLFFNCKLFVFQLFFMIFATVYGKIKWAKLDRWQDRINGVILTWFFIPLLWFFPKWWSVSGVIIGVFVGIATQRNIDWRRVWKAAQCSHVRLVLEKAVPPEKQPFLGLQPDTYEVANFGYPFMEIQPWREKWNKGRFEYRDPTFPTPPEFMAAVIQYAEDQVGKPYDHWQLISNGLHFIAWAVWPWSWGKELRIIKALNRKGGREHCSSGFTACLRYAELIARHDVINRPEKLRLLRELDRVYGNNFFTSFFKGYDTPVVPPGLVALSEDWRRE